MLDSQEIRRFRASCRMLSAHAVAPALGQVVTQYPRDRYSIEAAGEYRAVALEMFADWNQRVGRHTQLAVAAHTEGASA
jgi:chromosome partitioning protein